MDKPIKNEVAGSMDALVEALFNRGHTQVYGATKSGLVRQISDRIETALERAVENGTLVRKEHSYKNKSGSYFKYYNPEVEEIG
jgi:hypothetical protein